jgi:phytoene dehydrogenase-like protein
MKKKVDAVVIGSGPAGAITGAYLARAGMKTVIFEADSAVGGPRYGGYDLNGHHIDKMCHIPILFTAYNDGLGWWGKAAKETGAAIKFQFMPNTIICMNGHMVTIPYCLNGVTMAEFVAGFSPFPFPDKSYRELVRTFDEILAIPKDVVYSMEMECTPFQTWLDGVTDDEIVKRLLAVLASIIYVASADVILKNTSVTAIVGSVFQGLIGGYANMTMILGDGCDGLPKGFCKVVTNHGGEVLTNHPVTKVLIENGKATGVVVKNDQGGEDTYEAPYVIMASNFPSIPLLIEKKHIPQSIHDTIDRFKGLYDSVGIDVDFLMSKEFAVLKGSQIIVMSGEGAQMDYRGAILMPSFFETTLSPPGKQVIKAEKIVEVAIAEKLTDADCIKEATEFVELTYPGFSQYIEATHVGRAYPVLHFSILPGEKLPLQYPGIPGLYMCGDACQSPGIATERAASSGMTVAKSILRKENKGFLVGTN